MERMTAVAPLPHDAFITAENDGGICLMRRHILGWKDVHPFVAVLEANKSFADISAGVNTNQRFFIADATIGQYLAEAVSIWRTGQFMDHGLCRYISKF